MGLDVLRVTAYVWDMEAQMGATQMTTEEKKAKILAAAATFGHHSGLFINEANELAAEGKIKLVSVPTATGNWVPRWKLAA
jgi:hypothetical protein